MNCYGYKQVSIQIGRKEYRFQAIKADVQSPVIGWDFFRHYRIDFRWTRWGDVELFDKKSKIRQVLKFKSLPFLASLETSRLRVSSDQSSTDSLEPSVEIASIFSSINGPAAVNQTTESVIFQQLFQR